MAGITLIYQQGQKDTSFLMKVVATIEQMPDVHILMQEKELLLIKKSKAHYPVQLIDHPAYLCVVEGRIYGIDADTDDAFKSLLLDLFDTHKKDESLKKIRNLDGEFLICLFHKTTMKVLVVNDFLGRLPAYYMQNDMFILSRDINLLRILNGKLSIDAQGVYEFLRMGYPLGDKTLFENLKRLPPSSYIKLDVNVSLQSQSVPLQEWQEWERTINNPVEQLYELFKEALRNRLKGHQKPMLSLSGGLDSRIIMGEIEKQKKNVAYESFIYENSIIKSDVAVVKKLCSVYNTQFGLTELEEWSPGYFDEFIDAKFGMNYLGMAFIIPFLKSMAQKYDVMLTGDGGDKTLAYLYPEKHLFGKDLASQILQKNEVTPVSVCSQIFNFDIAFKEKEMRAHLNGYGYSNRDMDYKHFLIFERTKNWLFEGEDRNRQYIWSTSPFYHPGFFQMIHSIDERKKKNFNLYRSLTQFINPELNNITNANWGFPINHIRQLKMLLFKQKVRQQIKALMPENRKTYHASDEMLLAIKAQLMGGFKDSMRLNKSLNLNELSQESMFHMLTLLKVAVNMNIKE
jgi:asparagine synthase (glutamine-hydrolysing)